MEINDPYLTSRVEGTRLGQVAVFQCPIGFRLNGTSNLTCQASGKLNSVRPMSKLFENFLNVVYSWSFFYSMSVAKQQDDITVSSSGNSCKQVLCTGIMFCAGIFKFVFCCFSLVFRIARAVKIVAYFSLIFHNKIFVDGNKYYILTF
jgi:hypothetical protein